MSQTKSQLINPIDGNLNVTGIITANNVTVGAAQTSLVVQGNARITGILTVGTASITFDGNSDKVTIGTGVTIQSGVVSATSYFASSNRRVVALTPGDTTLWYQAAAPVGWTKSTTHNNKALRVVSGAGGGSGGTTAFTSVFASRTPGGSVSGSNSGGSVTGSVSGSNSGGSVANTTVTGSVSGSNSGGSVSNTTLGINEIPSHSHVLSMVPVDASGGSNGTQFTGGYAPERQSTDAAGGSGAHGHGFTNPSWSGSITMNAHNHTFTNPSWSGSWTQGVFTNPSWSGSFMGSSMDFNVQYIDMIVCSID